MSEIVVLILQKKKKINILSLFHLRVYPHQKILRFFHLRFNQIKDFKAIDLILI